MTYNRLALISYDEPMMCNHYIPEIDKWLSFGQVINMTTQVWQIGLDMRSSQHYSHANYNIVILGKLHFIG